MDSDPLENSVLLAFISGDECQTRPVTWVQLQAPVPSVPRFQLAKVSLTNKVHS